MARIRVYNKIRHLTTVLSVVVVVLTLIFTVSGKALALSGSDFNAGNIISDAVFTNTNTMSASDIQSFLEAQVPTCDTNGTQSVTYYYNSGTGRVNNSSDTLVTTTRAVYGQRYDSYYSTNIAATPYVCLASYVENPNNLQNNLQNPGASISGGESAAQIIYSAGQTYSINPQVILVTLEKEQGLVTDDWPWTDEYTQAMGYDCPDSAPCNGQYADFAVQVDAAAQQYRNYLNNPDNFNYVVGNNTIEYNPNSSCGSSTVDIQNQATAALYDYTPYQPDAAALANVSSSSPGGSGDSCSAYGNRNFWWYFNNWFGSTQTSTPYAWSVAGITTYEDSARTEAFTDSPEIDITPGAIAYVTLSATNNGYEPWGQGVVHLGTSYPDDRSSVFANSTWLQPNRIEMQQSTVDTGGTATFEFSITAPEQTGTYLEHFSLVADGITWMNDPDFYLTINVASPISATNSTNTGLAVNQYITPGEWLMSPDSQTTLTLQTNGTLIEYQDFKPIWSNDVVNSSPGDLVVQSDGNLVEYNTTGQALWASGTNGSDAYLAMQTDGNIVLYSGGGAPLWATGTGSIPSHLGKVDYNIPPGGVMFPGQFMQTADRAYTLVLQPADGNLVEYNTSGQAIWASNTHSPGDVGVMQDDGNFVIYSSSGQAIWASNTGGTGNIFTLEPSGVISITNANNSIIWNDRDALESGQFMQTADGTYTLVLQSVDGNLVEYNTSGQAIWASGTKSPGDTAIMQGDGNFVIYSKVGQAIWASGTSGKDNILALQSDGNLVIYGADGAIWDAQ